LLRLLPYTSLVFNWILNKKLISFGLSGICRIRGIEELLDTNKDLLHCDSWSPTGVFVENREANCARRINIGVEETLRKLALRRFTGIIFAEVNRYRVKPAFPVRPNFSR